MSFLTTVLSPTAVTSSPTGSAPRAVFLDASALAAAVLAAAAISSISPSIKAPTVFKSTPVALLASSIIMSLKEALSTPPGRPSAVLIAASKNGTPVVTPTLVFDRDNVPA